MYLNSEISWGWGVSLAAAEYYCHCLGITKRMDLWLISTLYSGNNFTWGALLYHLAQLDWNRQSNL